VLAGCGKELVESPLIAAAQAAPEIGEKGLLLQEGLRDRR
jgi:hypothetical protein